MSVRPSGEILVVDDHRPSRLALVALLRAAGYPVRQAADGASCLARIADRPPSLVLLDVSMPGIDGFETLRQLRAGPHRQLPVVLITGERIDPDSIGVGLELGAEHLRKPVRSAELLARIRAVLRVTEARRELEALRRDHTAMLVHDLKQPLASIALRAGFIVEEARDPELVRSGEAIARACRRLQRLVDAELQLSRVEAGQLQLRLAPLELEALVLEVVEPLRGLAERRGISLSLRHGGLPLVQGDRDKLQQVVENLIGNALKFTPGGGRIEASTRLSADGAELAVEDTGCGLDPAEAERIFARWHQARAGRERGGSGLGLAIARAIVEAHGGRIGASPRLDAAPGARFWFTLPLGSPGPA